MLNEKGQRAAGRQSGNALFLILIAVALFAALSYAITQSGRGSGSVDKETSMINAGQVTSFPAGVRTAVTRMMITGTPMQGATGVNVTTTSGATNQVFDPAGGGAAKIVPPTAAVDSGLVAWTFVDASNATTGFYIRDVATNVDVSGREVIAVLGNATLGVTLSTCQQIQKGLGAVAPYTPPSVAVVMNWAAPLATYSVAAANTLSGTGINGNPFVCYGNTTGVPSTAPFHYVHALAEG